MQGSHWHPRLIVRYTNSGALNNLKEVLSMHLVNASDHHFVKPSMPAEVQLRKIRPLIASLVFW